MRVPPGPPSRAGLEARKLLVLQRGGRLAPDVWLVEAGTGRAVVKDWAGGGRMRAWLGRWQSRREARIYEALAGHPAVPRLLGRVDAWAFALEHRPGRRLSRRHPGSRLFWDQLSRALRELHRRGVAHLDLRHRSNVRVDLAGRPVLVDFGAAVRVGPGARWLLPPLAWWDRRAIRKWRGPRRPRARIAASRDYASASSGAAGGGPSASGRSISRPT